MPALHPDSVAHHLDLVRRLPAAFDQAACLTVVPGGRDPDDVVEQLGAVTRRAGPMTADDFGEMSYSRWDDGPPTDELVWVVQSGPFVALLEASGFAGSMPEVLRPLSRDGHSAASMMWIDANGANRISFARDADVQSCQADCGTDEDLRLCSDLAPYLPEVWAMTEPRWIDYQAGGLAALEMLTGFRLTREHLAGRWPAVWFRVRQEAPLRPPSTLALTDVELALALSNASPVAYARACGDLAVETARAAEVSNLPPVVSLIESLAAGDLSRIDKPGLCRAADVWQDEFLRDVADATDRSRRRYFAGRVLSGIAGELTDELLLSLQVRESWSEAPYVLGDAWAQVRSSALRTLAG